MESRKRTWARAASLFSVALAALLAPLVFVSAANADSSSTPVATILKSGGTTFLGASGSYKFQGVYLKPCSQSYCAPDQAGRDLYLGFSGPTTLGNMTVCVLDSRYASNGGQFYCRGGGTINKASAQQIGLPGADAVPDGSFFVNASSENYYSGLLCAGTYYEDVVSGDASNAACGMDQPDGSAGRGVPRSGKDMGHVGEDPSAGGALPGQQEDGSVDPVKCVQQTVASGDGFDPVAYILSPVKCAFLWAVTMPTKTLPDLLSSQTDAWNSTQLGKTANSVDFYNAFSVDNSCSGVSLPLHLLKVPGGPTPDDIHILSTCDAGGLTPVANIVKLGLTLTVLLGGAFALIRIITEFVRGPGLGPAHKSDFDDVLWGK